MFGARARRTAAEAAALPIHFDCMQTNEGTGASAEILIHWTGKKIPEKLAQ